ncbi:lysozyme family protein [Nocardiopsis dassonvillei]|uniref:hypothetical protein n=1 Tax=Nocardiopsis dassonvillei TaxID=2014 RepID=UPI00362EB66F
MARPRRRRARRTGGGLLRLELTSHQQLRKLAEELRAQDKKLPGKLRRELRGAAKEAAKVAKKSARTLPSTRKKRARKGATRKRLRQRLASSVQVQASTKSGIRIVTKMPEGEEMLPRGMDSAEAGWKHPVFTGGSFDADTWVVQPGSSWFREPIAGQQEATQKRVKAVMDDFARQVTKKR